MEGYCKSGSRRTGYLDRVFGALFEQDRNSCPVESCCVESGKGRETQIPHKKEAIVHANYSGMPEIRALRALLAGWRNIFITLIVGSMSALAR